MNSIFGFTFGDEITEESKQEYLDQVVYGNITALTNNKGEISKITGTFQSESVEELFIIVKKYLNNYDFKNQHKYVMCSPNMLSHIEQTGHDTLTVHVYHSQYSPDYEDIQKNLLVQPVELSEYRIGEKTTEISQIAGSPMHLQGFCKPFKMTPYINKDNYLYRLEARIESNDFSEHSNYFDIISSTFQRKSSLFRYSFSGKTITYRNYSKFKPISITIIRKKEGNNYVIDITFDSLNFDENGDSSFIYLGERLTFFGYHLDQEIKNNDILTKDIYFSEFHEKSIFKNAYLSFNTENDAICEIDANIRIEKNTNVKNTISYFKEKLKKHGFHENKKEVVLNAKEFHLDSSSTQITIKYEEPYLNVKILAL